MAVVQNFNIDDKEKQPEASTPTSFNAPAAGNTPSQTPQTVNAPTSSGRFTNIQKYLNANKGYNQNQGGLAGQIYSNMQDKAGTVQNQLGQSQQQFQQQADQGRTQYNDDVVKRAINDPNQFVGNTSDIQAFEKLRDAQYRGPNELSNAPQIQEQANEFQSLSNLAQNEKDRPTLLRNLYGNPGYTGGQTALDNLLLQTNQQQLGVLGNLTGLSSQLGQSVQSGTEQAKSLAQQYAEEAQNVQNKVRGELGNAVTGVDARAQNLVEQAPVEREAYFSKLRDMLGKGMITSNEMDRMGLSSGQKLYNVDPMQFLKQSNFQATKQNVLNPEDYAKLQSLQKLAGNTATGDVSKVFESYKDMSQAGQYAAAKPYEFDRDSFLGATRQAEQDYNSQTGYHNQLISQQQNIQNQVKNNPNNFFFNSETRRNELKPEAAAILMSTQSQMDASNSQLNALFNKYNPGRTLSVTDALLQASGKTPTYI